MSMRAIELQFALHKNNEVGLLQNQLSHKPLQDQALLADASVKQAEKERQIAGKADGVPHASIHDQEREKSDGRDKKNARSKRGGNAPDDALPPVGRNDHPFKGKHIDLSL